MESKLLRFLKGYVQIEIKSPFPQRFFNMCAFHNIVLWGLCPSSEGYCLFLSLKDFFKLRPIARKSNTKVVVIFRLGMPFVLHKYANRKAFLISVLAVIVGIYGLSLFVWQIEINELEIYKKEEILNFLSEQNIQYGMWKGNVNCERVERMLRKEYGDVVWVSAALEGTKLQIQIKENTESYQEEQLLEAASDLVATKNGEIYSIVTRSGTPMVAVGQQVKKGQVLISGREERLDDNKTVIGYAESAADGDVLIQTIQNYNVSFPYEHQKKNFTKKKKTRFTIWFFHKKISILKGIHDFQTFESEETTQPLVIGNSFYLPVRYEKVRFREYELKTASYTKDQARAIANAQFAKYKSGIEKEEGRILHKSITVTLGKDICTTKGTVTIVEPAVTSHPLESLEVFEKQRQEMAKQAQSLVP